MSRKKRHNSDRESSELDKFSRRQWLALSAPAVVGFAAGCGGTGDDGTTTGDDGTTTGEPGTDTGPGDETTTEQGGGMTDVPDGIVDSRWVQGTPHVPSSLQFNEYNQENFDKGMANHLFDFPGTWVDDLADFRGQTLENEGWDINEERADLFIRDDYTWHNGEEFTAEDFKIKLDITEHVPGIVGSLPEYIGDVEVMGEKTLRVNFSACVNPTLFQFDILSRFYYMNTYRETYRPFAERFNEATSDSEIENVQRDIIGMTIAPDEVIGNGPFKVTNVSERRLEMEAHENHPAFDEGGHPWSGLRLNFRNFEYVNVTEDVGPQAVINNRFAMGSAPAPNSPQYQAAENNPDIELTETPAFDGFALNFNKDNEWYGDYRIRQAFAYAIDQEGVTQAVRTTGAADTVEYPCGIFNGTYEDFVPGLLPGNNEHDGLDPYNKNNEKARELAEEAGLEMGDNFFQTPDGEVFETEILSHPGRAEGSLAMAQQMKQAGFSTSVFTVPAPTWVERWFEQDYDVTTGVWADHTIPYVNYAPMWRNRFANNPEVFEVPMPVGDRDGDLEEVNVLDILDDLRCASGEEEQRLNELHAWVWNQALPVYNTSENLNFQMYNTTDWDFPPEDNDIWTAEGFSFFTFGGVRAKEAGINQ